MRKSYNSYDLISSEFGIGFTNKGETFFFDKEDYPKIKDICWYKNTKTGYIRGHLPNRGGRTSLHRVVMDAVKGETIDHINHDLDDNRKSNLRKCSRSQNSSNLSTRTDNKTGFLECDLIDKGKNGLRKSVQTEKELIWADMNCLKMLLKQEEMLKIDISKSIPMKTAKRLANV